MIRFACLTSKAYGTDLILLKQKHVVTGRNLRQTASESQKFGEIMRKTF